MRKYKLLLVALLGCLFTAQSLRADIIANPDVFFITPDAPYTNSYLDVLTNDFYGDDCELSFLDVQIVTLPSKSGSAAVFDAATHTIRYRSGVSSGVDSLVYSIKCPSNPSPVTAKAYLYIADSPDVISSADCFVKPTPIPWGIAELVRTTTGAPDNYVSGVSNILTGDIDNDGKAEIFVYNANMSTVLGTGAHSGAIDKILVFEYNYDEIARTHRLDLDYEIPLPGEQVSYAYGNFAIASLSDDADGCGSLFVAFTGTANDAATGIPPLLLRYKYTPGTGFVEEWRKQYSSTTLFRNPSPLLVDLMGDGHKQVVVCNRIYDAETGTLLIDGDQTPQPITPSAVALDGYNYSLGIFGHQGGSNHIGYQATLVAGDVDGDGTMELVGGDCVYKVSITDYNNDYTPVSPNTFTLWQRADRARPYIVDGGTALADFDLDGKLDVVVTGKVLSPASSSVYIYNPRTGAIMHTNDVISIPNRNVSSQPFVGDLDGDGYPEIAMTAYCIINAYKLDLTTGLLNLMWNLPTTDTSAATTLSLFDFRQSGTAQLIYRDETTLRIIDGREYADDGSTLILQGDPLNTDPTAGTRVLYTFSGVRSSTINEYPIVADITGDGNAEILATAETSGGFRGELRAYGPPTGVWAPARSVWNQIAYNPLWVNEDLTIPDHPLSPAAKFAADGGVVSRPFNNFLQQATMLNTEGTMTAEGADLVFKSGAPRKIYTDPITGKLKVDVKIQNIGGIPFEGPINFQLYWFDDALPQNYTAVGSTPYVVPNPSGLPPNAMLDVLFEIEAIDIPTDPSFLGYALTMNLSSAPDETPVYSGMVECHSGHNNRTLGFNVLDGMAIICEGSSGSVTVNPAGTFDVYWYKSDYTPINPSNPYDTYTHPLKDATPREYLLVQAMYKGTSNVVSTTMDSVFIYRAPDSLVWNNNGNAGDWHDADNWHNPASSLYPMANIPQACTNVYIPKGNTTFGYPDLTPSNTSDLPYPPFSSPTADSIYFQFGGEVKRPDLLTYNKAFIEAELYAHRWYMFAPPLQNFYIGDLYVKNPIPALDPITSYIKIWGENNSSSGPYAQYINAPKWNWLITEPDVTFKRGQALGIWASANDDKARLDTFAFPKKDTEYKVYYEGATNVSPDYPVYSGLDRTYANRFIFENNSAIPAPGADFGLTAKSGAANELVMIGNPFMAHLSFLEFYNANSTYIYDEYQILSNGSYISGSSTTDPYIAPMQAFIVKAKGVFPNNTLVANGNMTVNHPGRTLRSGLSGGSSSKLEVPVTVTQAGARSVTRLKFGDHYSATYTNGEDVMSLFVANGDVRPISGFSFSGDGQRLNLNALPYEYIKNGGTIPLGFRTPLTDKITINVGNLTNLLAENNKAYLHDAATGKDYDLTTQSMYTFDNLTLDENLFIDNRFSLKIVKVETAIAETQSDDETIVISVKDKLLHIESQEVIDEVYVYNVQGQIIYSAKPNNHSLNATIGGDNLVIVKVYAGGKTVSKKIIK
ncbi:T9SS type A sorting domain-containing protein [Viscerimonas tarda]